MKTHLLTEEKKREFCLMISIGCDRETARKYLGCSLQQLKEALRLDSRFARQLDRAEATPEFNHMRNLHHAAKDEKNWRVSVWWLERCAADRYAKRNPEVISPVQLRQVIQELSKAILGEVTSRDDQRRLLIRLTEIARGVEGEQQAPLQSLEHEVSSYE